MTIQHDPIVLVIITGPEPRNDNNKPTNNSPKTDVIRAKDRQKLRTTPRRFNTKRRRSPDWLRVLIEHLTVAKHTIRVMQIYRRVSMYAQLRYRSTARQKQRNNDNPRNFHQTHNNVLPNEIFEK